MGLMGMICLISPSAPFFPSVPFGVGRELSFQAERFRTFLGAGFRCLLLRCQSKSIMLFVATVLEGKNDLFASPLDRSWKTVDLIPLADRLKLFGRLIHE